MAVKTPVRGPKNKKFVKSKDGDLKIPGRKTLVKRQQILVISFITVDFALLSTSSTWDFGHRLVLSHFAIIASHFIGDFGRSLLPSPRQFSVKSAPQLVPKTRRHHRHSSTWSQFCQKFVKSTTGWQPHSQRKFRQIISSIEDRGKRSAPCFPQKIP